MKNLPLVLLAVVALTTVNRFGNEAVWDDPLLLELVGRLAADGELLRVFGSSTLELIFEDGSERGVDLYRPVTLLTFGLNHWMGGGSLVPFHATNLLLHVLCVLMVVVLARRLLAPEHIRFAPLSGAIFGFSPFLGEAHVWISGRFDVLSTCLGLCALIAWRRGVESKRAVTGWEVVAGGCFLLGLLSKESLVFAWPALILWPGDGALGWRRRLTSLRALAVASAVYLGLRALVVEGFGSSLDVSRLMLAGVHLPVLLVDGLRSALLPGVLYFRALNEDYAAMSDLQMSAVILLAAAIGVAVWRGRRRFPLLSWSVLWFACCLAPVAIITTELWPGFGRYLYLPMTMLSVGVAATLARLEVIVRGRRVARLFRLGIAVYLAILAGRSHSWVYEWRTEMGIYESILAGNPHRSHGYGWIGIAFLERRQFGLATAWLGQALDRAPGEQKYLAQIGEAYLLMGNHADAARVAARGAELHPATVGFQAMGGFAHIRSDPDRGRAYFARCLRMAPRHAQCKDGLALLERVSKHSED